MRAAKAGVKRWQEKITAHRRPHLWPPGRHGARKNQPGIQLAGDEQSVMNWFINRQDPGSTASHTMLMAESLTLNLLFRAVRPRAPPGTGQTSGFTGAVPCSGHWNFLTRSWKRDRQGSRKSISGCRQPPTRTGNNLINLINVFQLMPLLSLSPLVPRGLVYALK